MGKIINKHYWDCKYPQLLKKRIGWFIPFLMFFLFTSSIYTRIPNIRFDHITIEDGLSHSKVNTILTDSRGFMWFGTNDGLNRYDGYEIVDYKNNPEDTTTISLNFIRYVFEDSKERLWICTDPGGLNLYDRDQDRFIRYMHDPDNPASISSDGLSRIEEDMEGNLWVATANGLNHFNPETGIFKRYFHDPDNPNSLSSNYIQALEMDEHGILWIGTRRGGLDAYDSRTDRFTHYNPESDSSPDSRRIISIYQDREGTLWIGTEWNGLFRYHPGQNKFEPILRPNGKTIMTNREIIQTYTGNIWIGSREGLYIYDHETGEIAFFESGPETDFDLSNQSINCIYEDKNHDVWIGTRQDINYFVRHKATFRSYCSFPNNRQYLNDAVVWAIYADKGNNLWIGTEAGGLNFLNRETGLYTYYKTEKNNPYSLVRNNVKCIYEDKQGDLWIGTFRGGLSRLNMATKKFDNYHKFISLANAGLKNEVYDILEDTHGNIWCAVSDGVSIFNRDTERFSYYVHDPEDSTSLSNELCRVLYMDRDETIWIGTSAGLNRFNPESETFRQYLHDPKDKTTLSNNTIRCIFEDSRGLFWVGTQGGGLNLMDRKNDTFKAYREIDGLPNNSIYGILEDNDGNLWLSTNQGLSKFNPEKQTFRNYDTYDGLLSNQFSYNAYYKSKNGEMFFGSIKGFNSFYPDQIKDNTFIPPIVITDLNIFNQSVKIDSENSPLYKSIEETDEIVLSHKQSMLTFEFAALNFSSSEKNQYAYKLEGFDDDWNFIGTKRTATFTNLSPGTYTFRVKGSNNHGYWNEEGASIKIIITPPFYQTHWFKIIFSLVIVLCIVGIYRLRMAGMVKRTHQLVSINEQLNQQIRERKRAEKKIQHQLLEKEILLKEIHHRVKNNLQIITSLLHLQARNISDEKMLNILKESRERVRSMALVHERLYQTENLADIDFAKYIQNLIDELGNAYHMDSHNVEFDMQCESISLPINYAVPCGLILNELISNCLKHAFPDDWESERKIAVSLSRTDDILNLVVKDSGKGMPSNLDPRNSDSLGLKLVYILAEDQLKGKIEIEQDKGTVFRIYFPGLAK